MKNSKMILLLIATGITLSAFYTNGRQEATAQQPEKVHSIVKQYQPNEWYIAQSELWRKEIEQNPKNAEAWKNYFYANRFANFPNSSANFTIDKKSRMDSIFLEMGKNIPGTYEYMRCKLFQFSPEQEDEHMKLLTHLHQLNPEDASLYPTFIAKYEITGDMEKTREYCQKLYDSKWIDKDILAFNYNILMSVKKNGILFTTGDNDTFPARLLQEVKRVRPDITIINIYLASNPTHPEYLQRLLKQKNIILNQAIISKGIKTNEVMTFLQELCIEISKKHPLIPIHFASTLNANKLFPDSLYCLGLANLYSAERIDNLPLLKSNVENHFLLDYLKTSIYENDGISKGIVDAMSYNYITPFAMIYKNYYLEEPTSSSMIFFKEYAFKKAQQLGNEKELTEFLENN